MKRILVFLSTLLISSFNLIAVNSALHSEESALLMELKTQIANADVTAFKKGYAPYALTAQEQSNLRTLAHETHAKYTAELTAMKRAHRSINPRPIAQGTAQLYIALLCLLGAGHTIMDYAVELSYRNIIDLNDDGHKALYEFQDKCYDKLKNNIVFTPSLLVHLPSHYFHEAYNISHHKTLATILFAVPTLAALYVTYYGTTDGVKNIANGLAYKKYLETQLKRLDEIKLLLMNDIHTKDIK